MRNPRRAIVTCAAAALAISAAAIPAHGSDAAAKKTKVFRILVTNDDGVGAEGIDALVEALADLPKVKVTVVAPAENQSGTSDKTSPTPPPHSDATTLSGYKAVSVAGFPADSVVYALDELGLKPHLVVSGINEGQNLGAVANASGTVGAAKTAVRRGYPALAVSQGISEEPDYDAGVREAIKWVKSHRKALVKGDGDDDIVANLNVPTCEVGEVRGIEEVPLAPASDPMPAESNCESTLEDPAHDNEAFANGFATLSDVPAA